MKLNAFIQTLLHKQDVAKGQFLAENNWFEFTVFLLDWLSNQG